MDLQVMLDKCRRFQWSVSDLDWTATPRRMDRETETAVVQYFTDMAGIERLAAALFHEEALSARDPTLREIFRSFVRDEVRHSHAAQMLADHYDVHRYRLYQPNPHLARFTPHFVRMIRQLSPEVANAYITCGELILDIALLRSLDDFVHDEMSHAAMRLINRDESRHIAVDFHMVEYYSSEEHEVEVARVASRSLRQGAEAWWSFANVLYFAGPFFKRVFFEPMELTDPTGRRLLEAFKRVQLIATKPRVARQPFTRFMLALQSLHNNPFVRAAMGRLLVRLIGVHPAVIRVLYTEEERQWAQRASFDDLAKEALAAKRV